MDIWGRLFIYSSAALGAVFLMVALITLSNSEGGQLTVENVSHMSDSMQSFYGLLKWFVYLWLPLALFIFFRFLRRTFRGH